MLFAHHVALELFGYEFSPQGPFQHICAFTVVGLVLTLAVYGGWTLVRQLMGRLGSRPEVRAEIRGAGGVSCEPGA
jgi:hypothetical protein